MVRDGSSHVFGGIPSAGSEEGGEVALAVAASPTNELSTIRRRGLGEASNPR
jgi:hypothetical protein